MINSIHDGRKEVGIISSCISILCLYRKEGLLIKIITAETLTRWESHIRDKNNNDSTPFKADIAIELRMEIASIRVAQGIILY